MNENTETNSNLVTMDDGSIVNFGTRAKLVTTVETNNNGFGIRFNLINGKIIEYAYVADHELSLFEVQAMAFGCAAKTKSGTGLFKNDVDAVERAIVKRLAEFKAGIFVSRGHGSTTNVLNITQSAYGIVNELDIEDPKVIAAIKSEFAGMTKEEKLELARQPDIKLAAARLKLQQLEEGT